MAMETVHVVDDEPGVLKSLARLLRATGWQVEHHASAQDFLSRAGSGGCVLLDYDMPGMNGLEVQAALSSRGDWKVVFLTGRADIPTSVRAMKDGAVDFLVKPADRHQIIAAVERASLERKAGLARRELSDDCMRRVGALSPRERQVMGHVIAGRLNKQIAESLGTAEKTVKIQRARVMRKMGVSSVAELVRATERAGIEPVEAEMQTV
ncbi:MAG TPA: response regulator [Usitatibacter sp.]|jgi:FixJ family two-component response regulator